jgi:hypothetical protein
MLPILAEKFYMTGQDSQQVWSTMTITCSEARTTRHCLALPACIASNVLHDIVYVFIRCFPALFRWLYKNTQLAVEIWKGVFRHLPLRLNSANILLCRGVEKKTLSKQPPLSKTPTLGKIMILGKDTTRHKM